MYFYNNRLVNKIMLWCFLSSRWYWDILVVILLLFTVAILPVSIAFYSDDQLEPEWLSVNMLVDLLFLSDIIVNFRTGVMLTDTEDVSWFIVLP